jgi:inositol hexakisphosphate/diphosphoinositol-pentakisphosphate kinase
MAKKIESTHMQNILKGIIKYNLIEIVIFTEDIIFNKEIENWPIVDALIIFFSYGFPYKKGQKYVHLRKPFLINDFESQKIFWDRRKVLEMLKEENIPTPKCIIIDRGEEINNDVGINNNLNNSDDIENLINLCKNQGNNQPHYHLFH